MTPDREKEITSAIANIKKNSGSKTSLIRERWRRNYDIFTNGTYNPDKMEWQSRFSINKLETSVRNSHGNLVNILVNNPDWYELCPRSYNPKAEALAPTFSKILDYYLESAKFKKHASTFFLMSLISMGDMYVGWRAKMIQNPKYIIKATEKQRLAEEKRIAKKVANPMVENIELSPENIQKKLLDAFEDFAEEATGVEREVESEDEDKKEERYIRVGALDIFNINPELTYWEHLCQYMEDSPWRCFELEVNKYVIDQWVKMGWLSKSRADRIASTSPFDSQRQTDWGIVNLRYKNTTGAQVVNNDTVKLTFYFGPLIIDDKIAEEQAFYLIANDSVILRDDEYPFWEPPGHNTPVVSAAVRQVPFRPTGAGLGDTAVRLQEQYDSNWMLICDSFRAGVVGLNVVQWSKVENKSQLREGIYPGATIHVREDPDKVFRHVNLTSNIENQVSPTQTALERAIDSITGVNELMIGGVNPYSRTSAAETRARLDAGTRNVNTIALDLEQQFLIPVLEKSFARVLQFGLAEIESNPELGNLLSDEEKRQLSEIQAGDALNILNQWYSFKINGFSAAQDKNEQSMRNNEFLAIYQQPGPLQSIINGPELLKKILKDSGMKDYDKLVVTEATPYSEVMAENTLLMANKMVMPGEADDDNYHLSIQGPLASQPWATPAMRQHAQFHQQRLMMMQQQAGQNGGTEGQ